MLLIIFVFVGYGGTGSTTKDENEVEVDKLSKAIFATAIIEDDVPFVLFGEKRTLLIMMKVPCVINSQES